MAAEATLRARLKLVEFRLDQPHSLTASVPSQLAAQLPMDGQTRR